MPSNMKMQVLAGIKKYSGKALIEDIAQTLLYQFD
jgi:hypothetical protein